MISKLINYIMRDGKKRMAMLILKKSLDYINDKLHINPLKVLYEAINNVIPYIEVRNMKIGSVSYQIPIDIPANRRLGLGLRWMVNTAKQHREATSWLRLAWEIIWYCFKKIVIHLNNKKLCTTLQKIIKYLLTWDDKIKS
ncbi:30S ribosomal protein S7 [Candidatus Hodgkinia cicadicola]|uniref:30S ribosomal protein S7 n=1 Tax=Candidatus Hodgkinia cicadicola TaxID=573658 RepID=A0ABX4MIJ7_9HYPH|nr:30S ribosomal protein S7 [Candidatus Hodgkinia cicadicola]